MAGKKRIAYLVSLISSELSEAMWRGVYSMCLRLGYDVTIIAGRTYHGSLLEDHPANFVYKAVTPERFDGVVLYGGALNQYGGLEVYTHLLDQLPPLPRVHISQKVPGEAWVTIDNRNSITSMVEHLYTHHQCTNIAYFGGPQENEEAAERFEGYKAGLTKLGLPIKEQLIWEGDFTQASGYEGISTLIDKRGVEFDAVVCVDDDNAFGVLNALRDRGIRVPDQVKVTGFDNTEESNFVVPKLTTINQPFADLGQRAVQMLDELLRGHSPSSGSHLPAPLVIRNSCGCGDRAMELLVGKNADVSLGDSDLLSLDWPGLNRSLVTSIESRDPTVFIEQIQQLIHSNHPLYSASSKFNVLLSELWYNHRREYSGDQSEFLNGFIQQARLLISEATHQEASQALVDQRARFLQMDYINNNLDTIEEEVDFSQRFMNGFSQIKVHGSFIMVETDHGFELRYGGSDEQMEYYFPEHRQKATLTEILSDKLWNRAKRLTRVVEPIFFGSQRFGYAVYFTDPMWVDMADFVAIHSGSTLQRMGLLKSARKNAKAASDSLAKLQDAQTELVQAEKLASLGELVAGISHEINTPLGIGITASSFLQQTVQNLRLSFEEKGITRQQFLDFLDGILTASQSIQTNLDRAAGLVRSFKNVAVNQFETLARKFILSETLEEIRVSLQSLLKKYRTDLTILCPVDLELTSHPGAFFQIINNLVTNSILHGFDEQPGGTITLEVVRQGNDVILDYKDNGKGIPREVIPKIFDPFFTTRRSKGSTGLGMHIIHNIVSSILGGTIKINQADGAWFTVSFPLKGN